MGYRVTFHRSDLRVFEPFEIPIFQTFKDETYPRQYLQTELSRFVKKNTLAHLHLGTDDSLKKFMIRVKDCSFIQVWFIKWFRRAQWIFFVSISLPVAPNHYSPLCSAHFPSFRLGLFPTHSERFFFHPLSLVHFPIGGTASSRKWINGSSFLRYQCEIRWEGEGRRELVERGRRETVLEEGSS